LDEEGQLELVLEEVLEFQERKLRREGHQMERDFSRGRYLGE
jgi:hypothetical protein